MIKVKPGTFHAPVRHRAGWHYYRVVQRRADGALDKQMTFYAPTDAAARDYLPQVTLDGADVRWVERARSTDGEQAAAAWRKKYGNPRRAAKRKPATRKLAMRTARKRNPLPIPGGFEDPELYTMGYGLPDHLKGSVPNVDPEGTDVSAWVWDTPRGAYLLAFRGRSKKPVEYARYRSGDARDAAVASLIRGAKASLRAKEDRETAKRAYRHDFKVGDFFYTSWGYDQTNVDFYQILAVSEKSVKVAAVASKSAGHGYVLPTSRVIGPTKTVVPRGGGFKIEGHYAGKWSGRPVYATPSGWGH